MKAILEFEAPESYQDCRLQVFSEPGTCPRCGNDGVFRYKLKTYTDIYGSAWTTITRSMTCCLGEDLINPYARVKSGSETTYQRIIRESGLCATPSL